jgi:signal peptidase I
MDVSDATVRPESAAARRPLVAVVLSLLATGLGHLYCGRIVTGLGLFLASLLLTPVAVVAAVIGLSTPVMICLALAILTVIAAYLYAIVDSYRLARTLQAYQPRDYNRPILYVLIILVAVTYPLLAVLQLRANVVEAYYIPTGAMAPNIVRGDRVLVNKLTFRMRAPERGDLIVFRSPKDRRLTWIKRVIALPGDTIELKNNEVFVNDRKLERQRVPASSLPLLAEPGAVYQEFNAGRRYQILLAPEPAATATYAKATVAEGTCFVLGDSRDNSIDSRDSAVGLVPLGDILGHVEYIYYPAESWSRLGAYRD